jgi:hypothetical protein
MPVELPYLASYKNVGELFTRIASAKRPETFSTRFLSDILGLKSTGDRPLIALLKALGFIDAAGKPTVDYDALKNPGRAPHAIAAAIRRAYAPLFAANENAHTLTSEQLRGLIAQVAGTDVGMSRRIALTLGALLKTANFDRSPESVKDSAPTPQEDYSDSDAAAPVAIRALRPEFHYNIQIHLPSNGTEDTYMNIFNAVRKVFR